MGISDWSSDVCSADLEIMETLKKRLEEQQGRHQGGNKWVGTGGTSPFGNSGYNPEGVRIGGASRHKHAIKVWDKREFANLDNKRELGTRNLNAELRHLRLFAREGERKSVVEGQSGSVRVHLGGCTF